MEKQFAVCRTFSLEDEGDPRQFAHFTGFGDGQRQPVTTRSFRRMPTIL